MYGFYTRPPFWVGDLDEILKISKGELDYRDLTKQPILTNKINAITLSIFKDGLIAFEFDTDQDSTLRDTLKLLEYFNSFMFVIYNNINVDYSGKKCMLDPYVILDNDFIAISKSSVGFGDGTSRNIKYFNDRYKSNPIIQRVLFFSKSELEGIINNFKFYVNADKTWLLSYLNRFVSHYKDHLFLEAFVTSFFLVEVLINELWDRYLIENNERLNKKRKEYLKGRDITLAIKTNILELNNKISSTLFQRIDNLRGKRNKIVHDIEKLALKGELYSDDFEDMFETTNELLFLVEGFKTRLIGGYSFRTIR